MNSKALLPLFVATAIAQTRSPKPPLGSASQDLVTSSSPLLPVLDIPDGEPRGARQPAADSPKREHGGTRQTVTLYAATGYGATSQTFTGNALTLDDLKGQYSSLKADGKKY